MRYPMKLLLPLICLLVVLGNGFVSIPVSGQAVSTDQIQQHYHRAETAWKNRSSLLEAKVRVDQVLEEAPDHADALKLRAEVLMAMRRYMEALEDASRAIEISPKDGSAYLIHAEAARLNGDIELARTSLERAAKLMMNAGAAVHLQLSESAMRLGESDWAKAESYARVAHAQEPKNAQTYYQLARIFVLQGRIEAGATILEKGLRSSLLDPAFILNDSTLQQLGDHPAVSEYVN